MRLSSFPLSLDGIDVTFFSPPAERIEAVFWPSFWVFGVFSRFPGSPRSRVYRLYLSSRAFSPVVLRRVCLRRSAILPSFFWVPFSLSLANSFLPFSVSLFPFNRFDILGSKPFCPHPCLSPHPPCLSVSQFVKCFAGRLSESNFSSQRPEFSFPRPPFRKP